MFVVAHHGGAFGEHGRSGRLNLRSEVLDVPVFVRLPGQVESRRIRQPVQ